MADLWFDVTCAIRSLRRSPRLNVAILAMLAVGIGANTALFSVLHAVVLRPLPYREPGRLVMIWTVLDHSPEEGSSYANLEDWAARAHGLEEVAFFDPTSVTLAGEAEAERAQGVLASPNLTRVLGVQPMAGRWFTDDDAAARRRVVVIGESLWKRRFGGGRDAIGRPLHVDGAPLEVVGIMPDSFRFPERAAELWIPHSLSRDWPDQRRQRGTDSWRVIARLREGSTPGSAGLEMDALARDLAREFPDENAGLGARVVPLARQVTGADMERALWMLLAAVGLVLLIACSNVAHLRLAQGEARKHEMAIRGALGAGRARLIRQLLLESAVLALLAGGAGVLLARVGLDALRALAPATLARIGEASLDGSVLAFTLVLSLVVGPLFGLLPAWRTSGRDPARHLAQARGAVDGHRSRLRGMLVVGEFALALVLLAGAMLLLRSFLAVRAVDPGFRSAQVLVANLAAPPGTSPARRAGLLREVIDRVEALPGVEAVGATEELFIRGAPDLRLSFENRTDAIDGVQSVRLDSVTPGTFEALQVPLLRGRFFGGSDATSADPVAPTTAARARRSWPGEDPLGKRFAAGPRRDGDAWITVVGVVGDMRRRAQELSPMPQVFVPHSQRPERSMVLVVRTAEKPLDLVPALRTIVHDVDAAAPLYQIGTLDRRMQDAVAPRRFQTVLLGGFAAVALLLAGMGAYAQTRHAVDRRSREVGIRMALGAGRGNVYRMILTDALQMAGLGVALGLVLAMALTRGIRSLLYAVAPADPLTLAGVTLFLLAAGALAAYVPARRATRIDPVEALRQE